MTIQFPQAFLDPLDAVALPATLDLPFVPPPLILGLLTPSEVNAGSRIRGTLLVFNSQPFPVKEISGQVDFGGRPAGTLSDIILPPAPIPGVAEIELLIPSSEGKFPVTVSLDWFGTAVERTVGTIRINPGPLPPPEPPPPEPPPPIGPAISAAGIATVAPQSGASGTRVAAFWAAQNQGDQSATVFLQVYNMSMQEVWIVNGPNKAALPEEPAIQLEASFIAAENVNVLVGDNLMELRLVELLASGANEIRGVFPFPYTLITVPRPPTLIDLRILPDPPSVEAYGATLQLAATGFYSDGTQDPNFASQVAWSSTNLVVVTVGPGGLATGHLPGLAEIVATYVPSGVSYRTIITVFEPEPPPPPPPPPEPVLQSITILPSSGVTLNAGQTQLFVATGHYSDGLPLDLTSLVAWSSSSPEVASISGQGLATGLSGGTTQIRASLLGVISSATLITVNDPQPIGPVLSTKGILPIVPSSLVIGEPLLASWRCFNTGDQNGLVQLSLRNSTIDPSRVFSGPFNPFELVFPGDSRLISFAFEVPLVAGFNQMHIEMIEITGNVVSSHTWGLNATTPIPVARFSIGQFVVTTPSASFGGEIGNRRLHSSGSYYEYEIITCKGRFWLGDSGGNFAFFTPPLFSIGESVFVVTFTEPRLPGVIQCRVIGDGEWLYDIFISAGRIITEWEESRILAGDI